MRRIDRVQRGDEPPLLRGIQSRQHIEEVRFIDRPRRLRLVQQHDLRPDELDAVAVAATEVREVQADPIVATVGPAFAVTVLEEDLHAPRPLGCLARPELVMFRLGDGLACLQRDELAVVRDLQVPHPERLEERLLVASKDRDVHPGMLARLVTEEHVERVAAGAPPWRGDRTKEPFHLLQAYWLPAML